MTPPATAMILAAGLGTRLQPLTDVRAKPAVPVAGRPLARRIIERLAAGGITDIVLNLHHRPETIARVLGDGSDLGVRLRYSWEQPALLGSAGGPRLALPILGVDTFWLVNGDTLARLDFRDMAARHRQARARVTLAVVPNPEPHKYGGVLVDPSGSVTGFVPRGPAAAGTWHFIGVQLVEAEVFRPLRSGEPAATIGGLYDALIASDPGAIAAYTCDAEFRDIGTPADYVETSRALMAEASGDGWLGRAVRIDPTARVHETIVWDDVSIGPGAVVDRSIVTDGVAVPARAEYHDAILLRAPGGGVRSVPLHGVTAR
jgi:NDP-sugar pyrophosphorylase family protein